MIPEHHVVKEQPRAESTKQGNYPPQKGTGMAAPRAVFADASFLLNPGISGKGNWKNPLKYCW